MEQATPVRPKSRYPLENEFSWWRKTLEFLRHAAQRYGSVLVFSYVNQRNPNYYSDPEKWEVERWRGGKSEMSATLEGALSYQTMMSMRSKNGCPVIVRSRI